MKKSIVFIGLVFTLSVISFALKAQNNPNEKTTLSQGEQSMISMAALTAKGDLTKLKTALNTGQQNEAAQADQTTSQSALIFAKGEKITNDNFTGTVWLNNLVQADSLNQNAVGSVTFEPGARTKWHSHPAGQIILALDGVGYYQEKGSPKIIVHKGDVVKCPANIPHWHGAGADSKFVQIAITGREKGETAWLEMVSDSVYYSGPK